MNDWYQSMYKGFIFASIIAFIIGFFSSGAVSLDSYIAGCVALILGIMLVMIILIMKALTISQNFGMLETIYLTYSTLGPFFLMLGVVAFILSLMIIYKTPIIEQKVSHSYYTFSNISIIILLFQIYIIYTNINTTNFEKTGKMSKVTSSIIYLLGILGMICSVILFNILKYFTTDGFETIGM